MAEYEEAKHVESAVSKVMWVGRATVFLVGLSVILALLFGVAATALAGTGVGATFNLGQVNTVNKISSLIGSASSAMLKIDNDGAGPALALQVEPGKQPLTVNSERKVARLNADKLDGLDASAFDTSNTGKIHRIDAATRLDGGETSLVTVGPFKFVGECHVHSDGTPLQHIFIRVSAAAKPHYGAVWGSSDTINGNWDNSSNSQMVPLRSVGSDASATAIGYIYSPGNNPGTVEKSVTFHLYQNRNVHPTSGNLCTFGGYVVEDV